MCLISDYNKPRKTKVDLRCYKLLYYDLFSNTFTGPYYKYYYTPNSTHKGLLDIDPKQYLDGYKIYLGFHSFINPASVEMLIEIFMKHNCTRDINDFYIANCIIPKGSLYYEGMFKFLPAYVSDTLIINDINPIEVCV